MAEVVTKAMLTEPILVPALTGSLAITVRDFQGSFVFFFIKDISHKILIQYMFTGQLICWHD